MRRNYNVFIGVLQGVFGFGVVGIVDVLILLILTPLLISTYSIEDYSNYVRILFSLNFYYLFVDFGSNIWAPRLLLEVDNDKNIVLNKVVKFRLFNSIIGFIPFICLSSTLNDLSVSYCIGGYLYIFYRALHPYWAAIGVGSTDKIVIPIITSKLFYLIMAILLLGRVSLLNLLMLNALISSFGSILALRRIGFSWVRSGRLKYKANLQIFYLSLLQSSTDALFKLVAGVLLTDIWLIIFDTLMKIIQLYKAVLSAILSYMFSRTKTRKGTYIRKFAMIGSVGFALFIIIFYREILSFFNIDKFDNEYIKYLWALSVIIMTNGGFLIQDWIISKRDRMLVKAYILSLLPYLLVFIDIVRIDLISYIFFFQHFLILLFLTTNENILSHIGCRQS